VYFYQWNNLIVSPENLRVQILLFKFFLKGLSDAQVGFSDQVRNYTFYIHFLKKIRSVSESGLRGLVPNIYVKREWRILPIDFKNLIRVSVDTTFQCLVFWYQMKYLDAREGCVFDILKKLVFNSEYSRSVSKTRADKGQCCYTETEINLCTLSNTPAHLVFSLILSTNVVVSAIYLLLLLFKICESTYRAT